MSGTWRFGYLISSMQPAATARAVVELLGHLRAAVDRLEPVAPDVAAEVAPGDQAALLELDDGVA